jgi:hypothetical protein
VVAVADRLDGVAHGVVVAEEEEEEAVGVEVVVEVADVAGASEGLDEQLTIHCELTMGVGNRMRRHISTG